MKPPEILLRKFTALIVFDFCGEFAATYSDLLSGLDILEREAVGLYLVFADNEHIANTSFARISIDFSGERIIAQFRHNSSCEARGKPGGRTIHARASGAM